MSMLMCRSTLVTHNRTETCMTDFSESAEVSDLALNNMEVLVNVPYKTTHMAQSPSFLVVKPKFNEYSLRLSAHSILNHHLTGIQHTTYNNIPFTTYTCNMSSAEVNILDWWKSKYESYSRCPKIATIHINPFDFS